MIETTVKIDGMMCSMCESHVNDAIRNHLNVKKVSASHSKGEATIISEDPISEGDIEKALDGSGYTILSVSSKPMKRRSSSASVKSKIVNNRPALPCMTEPAA